MPFYGKPTLQKVYRTWNGAKRKHVDRYIEVAYGRAFLMELKKNVSKKGQGKSSVSGRAISHSQKKTESTLTAQRNNPFQTRNTDEGCPQEASFKAAPGDKPRRPQSQGRKGTGEESLSQGDDATLVMRSRGQRRSISGDVSSTLEPKEDSRLMLQDIDEHKCARMVSQDSMVDDVDFFMSKKVRDKINTNITRRRRPSRNIPRMNNEGRDDNTEGYGNLKLSSSQTSQDAAPRGKGRAPPSEEPKPRRSGKGGSSKGSEVKQPKRQAGSSNKLLGGKMTKDGTRITAKQGKAKKQSKMVEDNRCEATSVKNDDSSLENQYLGVTASEMMQQSSSGENMDEENVAGVGKVKVKQSLETDFRRVSVNATTSMTSASQAKQIVQTQQQQTSAGRKKVPKRRHLEEGKSFYTSGTFSSEADSEQSTARNLRVVTESGVVMNKKRKLELQNSQIGSEFHKIQPLNVDVGSLTEATSTCHESEDNQDERMVIPPNQLVSTGQTGPGQRCHVRKRKWFTSGPRTRLECKYEFQRESSGFRCQPSGAHTEINELSLQQPRSTSETEMQNAFSTEHGLAEWVQKGLSCPQERAVVTHRPLRLRQTARKCCPQRRKGAKDHGNQTGSLKMHQVTSSPTTDHMTSLESPGRFVSVKLHKLQEAAVCNSDVMKSSLKTDGQMKTGLIDEGANQMPVQTNLRSLQREEGDSEDENRVDHGIVQVCVMSGPEPSEHEEIVMSDARRKHTKENEKPTDRSHLKYGKQRPKVIHSEQQQLETFGNNNLPVIESESHSHQENSEALVAVGLISKKQALNSRVDDTTDPDQESDRYNAGYPSSGCHKSSSPTDLKKEYPSFGNQQKEMSFLQRSNSTCEAGSNSAVKPRSTEMFNSFDENLWNLAVAARIEDVPLLEEDDEGRKSSLSNETEMPMSYHEVHQEDNSQDSSPHNMSQESQAGFSSVRDAECNTDANDINVTYEDSIVNESVEDGDNISPIDNPLPGLSCLKHNLPIDNLSPRRNSPVSPVFGLIPKVNSKQTPMMAKKTRRTRSKSLENQENIVTLGTFTEDDLIVSHRATPQDSEQIGNRISRLRHRSRDGSGSGSIATVTKRRQSVEGQNRTQSTSTTEIMENADVLPMVPDMSSSGIKDGSLEDINSYETKKMDYVVMGTLSLAKMPGILKQEEPAAYRKIRTPAEKKQGWSNPEHPINYLQDPSPKEGGACQDTVSEENSIKIISSDQQLSLTNAQRKVDPANSSRSQSSRKQKRSNSQEGRVRGQSGWEESLRQKLATVSKFQAGDSPKSPKKHETVHEMRRWQSPVKTTPTVTQSRVVKPRRSENPTPFREVWKPPPAKKLKSSEDAIPPQKLNEEEESDKLTTIQVSTPRQPPVLQDKFCYGELTWGKMKGFNWWPGTVVHHHKCGKDAAPSDACWVKWFGDDKFSKLNLNHVTPFAQFSAHFSQSTFLHTALYRRAVFQALQLASTRAGKTYSINPSEYKAEVPRRTRRLDPAWLKFYKLCSEMISWAKEGFKPSGQDAIMPSDEEQLPPSPPSPSPHPSPVLSTPTKRTGHSPAKGSSMWKDIRDIVMAEVDNGIKRIEEICIGCGSSGVTAEHPFFVGGLCEVCRIEFVEMAYVFDEDGYQCFCCICAEGKDIILCDQPGCYRSFCHDCMEYLVGSGTVQAVLATDQWRCYMCSHEPTAGLLTRRTDWPQKLLLFFQQDRDQDLPPMRTYAPVEMDQRKPIRVLSLFDGIGTGMLVLKELGVRVECYYASEISEEARQVSSVRHDGIIRQLDDVRNITEQEIQSLGPFDLLIGGSPCNDLSIANPARKGLFEGTGRLFFDFYRILTAARPNGDSDRPFFWLFENVVGMQHKDKMDISRFLQCDPVVVDAKDVSPAHRARYFWGNLPGMNRPNVATDNNTLCLQDCLEPNCNRQAQFSKVRTVTSKLNSIKQKNEQVLPVLMNGQEDTLWCTEMERIFGFPEHYTDIANMSRTSRHKLIGQAWSVPVIKHLLAPLKEHFACETHQ